MLDELRQELQSLATPERAANSAWFFKTGQGQYGEGDMFLGITVPAQRLVAKKFVALPLSELDILLQSQWHEERLTALIILVMQFKKAEEHGRHDIYEFYLARTGRINNWDLVDTSARDIVGGYIYDHADLLPILDTLAVSSVLWERRIAIVATFYFLGKGEPDVTIKLAKTLLYDHEDLMHKAVGWALREMGKRVDRRLLVDFLDEYAPVMPRTALRYAIEHLSLQTRQHYLKLS